MNKEAKAAKAILGFLRKSAPYAAVGLAGAGAGGVAGHRFGVRAGAERMGNEMATAFSEANAKENKAIADSFKAFNKKENAIIANQYLRRGINMGYSMATAKPDKGVSKTASDIAEKAFYDELEKLGFSVSGAANLAKRGIRSLKRLSSGLKGAGGQVGKAIRTKGAERMSYLSNAGSMARRAVARSPRSSAIIAGAGTLGATYGTGRATASPRRTVVDYRY